MNRREFIKLAGGMSLLALCESCCHLKGPTVFPFGTDSGEYYKRHFEKVDRYIQRNNDKLKDYFMLLDDYLRQYRGKPKSYRLQHEPEVHRTLIPLFYVIEHISRQSLNPADFPIIHDNSPSLANRVTHKRMKKIRASVFSLLLL